MNKKSDILHLPNEILVIVIQYLKGADLISFITSCHRFSALAGCIRHLDFQKSFHTIPADLKSFMLKINPLIIHTCDFNHCYWLPGTQLLSGILRLVNLRILRVAETKLKCFHIDKILNKCPMLVELSFSITSVEDFWTTKIPVTGSNLKWLISKCVLSKSKKILEKLHKLVLYLQPQPAILSVMLSLCCGLTDLQLYPYGGTIEDKLIFFEISDEEEIKKLKLRSLILASSTFSSLLSYAMTVGFIDHSSLICSWYSNLEVQSKNQHQIAFSGICSNGVNLDNLLSLRTTLFPNFTHMWPSLRLLEVDYIDSSFLEMCSLLPNLELFRINSDHTTKSQFLCSGLHLLPHLKCLSLSPTLLSGHKPAKECKTTLHNNCMSFLKSYHLEVLEISSTLQNTISVREEDLLRISENNLLKSLTLDGFSIKNGTFIQEILDKCKKLQVLRLSSLGPSALCCYTRNLITGLHRAENLKCIRLEQANVVPLKGLLAALETCSSLVQLGLIVPSSSDPFKMNEENFTRKFQCLIRNLKCLSGLFCVFSIPKSHCSKAMKSIRKKFQCERPALSIDICNTLNSESCTLPWIHKDILVDFQSFVGRVPYHEL